VLGIGACCMVMALMHSVVTPRIVKQEVAEATPRVVQAALALPPMLFHSTSLSETTIVEGSPLGISYTYDKRAECTPELGTGRYVYYAWIDAIVDGDYVPMLPFRSANREPAGENKMASSTVSTSGLKPGNYAFQMMGRFTCDGEAGERVAWSEAIPFTVTAAP